MPARTVEELGDDLDSNFQWRRTELAVLKRQVEQINPGTELRPAGRATLRSAIALLYAHWEGFLKEALQSYLDFVARRKLSYGDLSDPWIELAIATASERVARHDEGAMGHLMEIVKDGGSVRARIPRRGVVNAQANLRHSILTALCERVGLRIPGLETKQPLIDRSLCDSRNDIAHGKSSYPTRDEYLSLHVEIVSLMETVRDEILAAARLAAYRS